MSWATSWAGRRDSGAAVEFSNARRPAVRSLAWVWGAVLVTTLPAATGWGNDWNWFPASSPQTPHPAVVRIVVEESDGASLGSGSLVDVRGDFGLVVTNWHVVRDAAGTIHVVFPDGFRSGARVLKADADWDLAALLIWRPAVAPLVVSDRAPVPGETLRIAGYGAGTYRTESGRCTQYLAPSERHPYELVELSAAARQGDSGGPILNQQGQLAGVLFGSVTGTTSGSCAPRVRQFLASAWPGSLSPPPAAAPSKPAVGDASPATAGGAGRAAPAGSDTRSVAGREAGGSGPGRELGGGARGASPLVPLPWSTGESSVSGPLEPLAGGVESSGGLAPVPQPAPGSDSPRDVATGDSGPAAEPLSWRDLAGRTGAEQVKSLLALFGAGTLLLHVLRWLSPPSP